MTIEASEHLENIINSLYYEVEDFCSFRLKGMPLKKTFINDASCQGFTIFKPQIFFNTPREEFIILLYIKYTSQPPLVTQN